MSDVIKGGGTAFPFLNTVVWPKKGAAAFWYNLYESGDGDYRTKHAGCPVLAGTKWGKFFWHSVLFTGRINLKVFISSGQQMVT